jgi:hypothetical protein
MKYKIFFFKNLKSLNLITLKKKIIKKNNKDNSAINGPTTINNGKQHNMNNCENFEILPIVLITL